MLKRLTLPILVVLVVAAVIVVKMVAFRVDQREQALVLLFGEPKRVEHGWTAKSSPPGLKFKAPWENVVYFDRRVQMLEIPARQVLASDQEVLVVDVYALYRITNPLLFYQRVTNIPGAEARMKPFMEASLKSVLGTHTSAQIISGKRIAMMKDIQNSLESQIRDANLGVKITDVRIRRADLPTQNANRVFKRMISERQQEADKIRAEGNERALTIRAEADKQKQVILAKATEESSRVRGAGDAERNDIYAKAYLRDPEFFAFYRSMEAYQAALADGNTSMVLSPNSEFFRYFQDQQGK